MSIALKAVRTRSMLAAALLLTLAPACCVLWLWAHPAQNVEVEAPTQHFFIVTIVSMLALGVAVLIAIAALRIQQYRVLFLALGFMSMGGLFAVHGLATPGMVMPAFASDSGTSMAWASDTGHAAMGASTSTAATAFAPSGQQIAGYGYGYASVSAAGDAHEEHEVYDSPGMSVVGLSAFLSLLVPALLFAVSYSRLGTPFGWRIPFRPGGAVIVVAGSLAVYAALVFARSSWFSNSPLASAPGSDVAAGLSCLLFVFAAWRQGRTFWATRLPLQGALAIAFLLLVQAQITMATTDVWTLAWWSYHVTMLVAVLLALGALLYEYVAGSTLRRVLEGALELHVAAGVEIEHVEAVAALAAATEARDPETRGHTARVAEVAVGIGRELELPHETLRVLARAALLHDIGKIRLPDSILLKPGPLEPDEWESMKLHPQLGLDILQRVGKLEREAAILVAHHERMNGSGYPHGLTGDAIPLEARIISVADTYDALVSDRPYRKGLPRERALSILQEEKGPHLYPPAVEAFLRMYNRGELNWLVNGVYRSTRPAAVSAGKRRAERGVALADIVEPGYWRRRLEEECARAGRYQSEFIVLLVGVNALDEWLRPPSEKALRAVGHALFHRIRGSDVITRIRYDRFALLLTETPADVAYPLAVRLVAVAREQFAAYTGSPEPLQIEFGIAAYSPLRGTPDELLEAAERDLTARALRESALR